MYQNYLIFEELFKNHSINMSQSTFDQTLYSFSFDYISSKNVLLSNYLPTKAKEFIIADHIAQESDEDESHFIFCFNFRLFIVKSSDILLVEQFFQWNKDIEIICLKPNIQFEIQNAYLNLDLKFTKKDQSDFINKEIPNFLLKFSIANKAVKKFWEDVRSCIAGFLIKRSYADSSFKRINEFPQNFNEESKEIEIKENEFISLRKLGQEISSIELIYHIEKRKLFALKIQQDDELYALIERERDNYLNLHHLFLLKYYGYVTIFNKKCLVLEFLNGENLEKIKQLKLGKSDKICIIYELIKCIQYIHSRGYIYRDLKPNNIMIDKYKTAVLIDLDRLIKNASDNMETTRNFSHIFIAPEIISGRSFSFSVDIYSLGLIIYFIINEEKPKFIDSKIEINFPSEYSKLEKICKECTQIDPNKRPTIDQVYNEFTSYFNTDDEKNSEIKQKLTEIVENIYVYENQNKQYDQKNFDLGMNYKYSNDSNEIKYVSYIQKSAELKNPEALMKMGDFYIEGKYFSRNISKAIQYYSMSADLNWIPAYSKLGDIYLEGDHVQRDIIKAIKYYNYAYEYNDLRAQIQLGQIYCSSFNFKEAFQCFLKAATVNNDALSQNNAGTFLLNGIGCERDINQGIHYLILSSNQNFSEASFNLGDIYSKNNIVPKDMSKSIYYMTRALNQNHPEAQYFFGVLYENGQYVQKDITKSIYYYKLAADQNHVKAQYNLAVLYYKGQYVEKDINKAIYYATRSANNNFDLAQLLLGIIYYDGDDNIRTDIKKSIYYLNLAANKNNADAQFLLGCIYQEAIYVPKDVKKAIYYFSIAAQKGKSNSYYRLGLIYLEIDIKKAIYYLELASLQNDSEALYELAVLYRDGERVKKDINKAINYFQRSANLNNNDAQNSLGVLYDEGIHVKRDTNKAIFYYKLAASQNNELALFNLACFYLEKYPSKSDFDKAIYYLTLSAEQENRDAQYCLAFFYFQGKFVKRDIKKAIYYYKELSSFNYQYAKNNLGIIYKNGDGVEANIAMAIEYFNEAIKQKNDPIAMYNLAHIYLYEEDVDLDLDKAIDLLIKSVESNSFSYELLCLALIKKHKNLTMQIIKKELEIEDDNDSDREISLASKILSNIQKYDLESIEEIDYLYIYLMDIELVYDIEKKYYVYDKNRKNELDTPLLKKLKDINDNFYEGFGNLLFND